MRRLRPKEWQAEAKKEKARSNPRLFCVRRTASQEKALIHPAPGLFECLNNAMSPGCHDRRKARRGAKKGERVDPAWIAEKCMGTPSVFFALAQGGTA